ncbi:hypothetical protein PF004_g1218 [Phytophthora fragariae]|uniref:Uncharacterized protein n=1 Tax=Phytophthora fragariae TaxID=53985 RepID=A0A6G0PTG9_9STRA|nr:hypothetical protein PF004_g1218 [Phytophthora fragariae]
MQTNSMDTETNHTLHHKRLERVEGIQSGELFVRVNNAELCEPQGTLHGAHPFLQKLLNLQDDDTTAMQRLVQPSEAKLSFARKLRRQIQQRKRGVTKRWGAVRDAVEVYDSGSLDVIADRLAPVALPAVGALDRYSHQFQRLEQAYRQHITTNILHLYALLEAERQYIAAWSKREAAKCRDQRSLTKLLYQFNSFALQLESETSGQVRMWRLPPSDAQRMRCVKAATENIKKRFFAPSEQSLEVLEVYKIENRVLLTNFQRFTTSLAQTTSDIKIKGLFCSVPAESVERCVVYGMHTSPSGEEPHFVDSQRAEVKIFNRSMLLQGREDAPGTNMAFRARSKVSGSTPLHFPRSFSRYSTLEEMRSIMTASPKDQPPPVLYLGLCRVAVGKTVRVVDKSSANFPDDPAIGALHFTNEEEYLVRFPDAVVPEFIIQVRIATPPDPLVVNFSEGTIIPVSLTSPVSSLPPGAFQDFIYSAAFDSASSAVSAFPLAFPASDRQHSFFAAKGPPGSPTLLDSQQQSEEALIKNTADQKQISPEKILANCANQKTRLRENLQRAESLFWARAREIWEEEGIRSGVKVQLNHQLQSLRTEEQIRTQ